MTARKNSSLKYKKFKPILYLFKRLHNNENTIYKVSTNKDGIKQTHTNKQKQTKVA
jgi:hypothetical protein